MACLDLPSADVESGKQRRGAVSLVLVVETLQSLPVGKPKIALSALQGLNRRLLIDTQDYGMVRRCQINPHQIRRFGGELRVGRDAPTVPPLQADAMASQHSPDLACRHITQGSGDQTAAPTGVTRRRRLIEPGQDTPPHLRTVTPPRAGPGPILQADQSLHRETSTPLTHRTGAHSEPLRDGCG